MWSNAATISLDLIGVLLLADIKAVAERTVLRGASPLDALVLCPGLHRQQDEASTVHAGEFPACAAMTTGYVFRIENPATVAFLQRVGRTGELTTLIVRNAVGHTGVDGAVASMYYTAAILLSLTALVTLLSIGDWWAVAVILILCLVRLTNATIIQRRAKQLWHGAPEPGQSSDLLVLLSYDRWIRIQGLTDDVKAVTSGRWLREATPLEDFFTAAATIMTYIAAVLAANASWQGKLLLLVLFCGSAGLLGLTNISTSLMLMKGKNIEIAGERKIYRRRRDLADELIREHKRDDWAVAMGMIVPDQDGKSRGKYPGPVIM